MTIELALIIILSILALLTLVGFPGPFVIGLAVLGYGIYDQFSTISGNFAALFVVLSIVGILLDNLFTLLGAKKFGASTYGMVGALLGLLFILILGPFGIILGPFLGALIGEMAFAKKDFNTASKASLGAVVGVLTGIITKFLLAVGMVIALAMTLY